MSSGLGEDWQRILEDLKVLVPIYEKGNRILSFGRTGRLRRDAIKAGLPSEGAFVDVGSGPGSMSVEALAQNPSLEAVLVDPIPEMLAYASLQRDLDGAMMVLGVYEMLPFREECFTGYFAGFTLRDARDRGQAVREAGRVLRPTGSAVVLDLGNPDSRIKRALVGAYWRLLAPVLLFALMGHKGRPYRDIYLTVRRLPTNSQMAALFRGVFGSVNQRKLMLDGVLQVVARSPIRGDQSGTVSITGWK